MVPRASNPKRRVRFSSAAPSHNEDTNVSKAYYDALLKCAARYDDILRLYEPSSEVRDFIDEFIDGCINEMPLNKLNRWLGYIQGVLIERGYTTVQAERNWTRPLFRPLDFG